MKCKLVGYRKGSFTNKDTGELTNSTTLFLVREPNLREADVTGLVAFSTTIYGDSSIAKLPALKCGVEYDCDVGYSKGKYYLNSMT